MLPKVAMVVSGQPFLGCSSPKSELGSHTGFAAPNIILGGSRRLGSFLRCGAPLDWWCIIGLTPLRAGISGTRFGQVA